MTKQKLDTRIAWRLNERRRWIRYGAHPRPALWRITHFLNYAQALVGDTPELKETVRTAAVNEHRSIANMIAVMIRDYCGRVGVEIQELTTPVAKTARKAAPRKS